jgi:hypothetical protein
MTDDNAAPGAGHNLPDIDQIRKDMEHHAKLWVRNVERGDNHKREIMTRVFRLRSLAEDDPNISLMVEGMLSQAGVPGGKRSKPFTRLLNLAFRAADWEAEKSRVSRWAGSLQHVWSLDPRPSPEEVLDAIKREGGEVVCNEKTRANTKASAGTGTADMQPPKPIKLPCDLSADFGTQTAMSGRIERTPAGEWQFVPRKGAVVSSETTQATEPEPASTE